MDESCSTGTGVSRIRTGRIFLSTFAYTFSTFTLAVGWHVVLFEDTYRSFGYFEGEPNFLLGLLTIVLQGIVLSMLYPFVDLGRSNGLKYAALVGAFFWTSHVLAFLAKQSVANPLHFAAMESFYLVLQFGVFGLVLGFVYPPKPE